MQKITLIFATLLACTGLAAADKNFPTVSEVIAKEGELAWTDGSSYYKMTGDGKFVSGPMGMGGRTIQGHWKADGNLVTVNGTWSRVNGLSAINDFRRMKFGISPTSKMLPAQNVPMGGTFKFHEAYFEVEELVKTKSPE